jgi:hypothetical protein
MSVEGNSPPSSAAGRTASAAPLRKRSGKNRLLLYAIVLVVVFLLGFVPQYLKSYRLTAEVQTLSWQNKVGAARDLIGLTFLELSKNNFGVAAQHASQFFNQIRLLNGEAIEPAQRDLLQQIGAQRDAVTAGLAQADPAVRAPVQEIFSQMHQLSAPQLPPAGK